MSFPNYEKNYNVGNIRLDTPYTHFVYELPLLSFGDVLHTVNLSLVYQSKMSGNPYNMAAGHKLNLQKRIIFSDSGLPLFFEDTDGRSIALNKADDTYSFSDESRRIIRKQGNAYKLEHSDFSYECYDVIGRIDYCVDKYGETILNYSYENGKLKSITYRENKKIELDYNNLGLIEYIHFICNNSTICTSEIIYPGSCDVRIKHYSGVDYYSSCHNGYFEAYSTNSNESYSNTKSHKITCERGEDNSLFVQQYIGSKNIDQTRYKFLNYIEDNKYNLLEIVDFHGVTTRVQFENDKPSYSYEYREEDFPSSDDVLPDFSVKSAVSIYNNGKAEGTQTYSSGIKMIYNSNFDEWYCDLTDKYGASIQEYAIITGWIKMLTNNTVMNDPIVCTIVATDMTVSGSQQMVLKNLPLQKWIFFSMRVNKSKDYNGGLVGPVIKAQLNQNNHLVTADFRVTPQHESMTKLASCGHVTSMEDVLIFPDGEIKPFYDFSTYYLGYKDETPAAVKITSIETEHIITPEDLLKYQLERHKNARKTVYYNKCRGIINASRDLTLGIGKDEGASSDDEENKIDVMSLVIARRYTKGDRHYLCKSIIGGEDILLTEQTTINSSIYSENKYNRNLDLVSSYVDGVTTIYERNNKGLVTHQTDDACVDNYATYDEGCTKLLTTTDEFNNVTSYLTDSVWGTITRVTLADGTVMTEMFDDDHSFLKMRNFSKNGAEKDIEYTYSNGELVRLKDDSINYTFGYSYGELAQVKKFNATLMRYSSEENGRKLTAQYPTHSITQRLDAYGRVISIEDEDENKLLEYDYDILPTYNSTNGFTNKNVNNGSSKLASITDHTTGKTVKYAYDKDKLTHIYTYNSTDNCISQELVDYDSLGRAFAKAFSGSALNGAYVVEIMEYATTASSPAVDNRVSKNEVIYGGEKIIVSSREYDTLKRLDTRDITLGNNSYRQEYSYDHSRLCGATHFINNKLAHIYAIAADERLRTKIEEDHTTNGYYNTYSYDQLGRLAQENNQQYGNSIKYTYDNAGNITGASYYPYVRNGGVSSSPTSTDVFAYHTSYRDRLIGVNGSNIVYDNYGDLYSETTSDKQTIYSWSRGKLSSVKQTTASSVRNTSFIYDAYGRRIKKIDSTTLTSNPNATITRTTNYVYDSYERLLRESTIMSSSTGLPTTSEIVYFYDGSSVEGFLYNSGNGSPSIYTFDRNIRGDVVAILDNSGNTMVKYAYDAFGNCKVLLDTAGLSTVNPIRYRGYYYDHETGLYYLNARYYNPEWRRFISPDSTDYIDPDTTNGLNLYAYCGNNPVMGYDPYGTFDLWEFFRGVGNIVTGALAIGVGAIVLIGGAPIGMLIVAGITVGAGVLTLNNGIADTVGSFTGYNYMSDGLFNGNTTAYNWYSGITGTVAGIGMAICGNFIKTEYFMRGATPGTEGKMTLQPGMELDRYGAKYGRFLTNPGTTPGQLDLPASNNLVLNHYKVLKPFKVATGIVAGGGGFQYFTWRSVHRLIQMGYLAII